MPRVTINIPNDIHDKLLKLATDNDDSLSATITKMAELGLLLTESQNKKKNPEDAFSEIEKYCFKLVIQANILLKNLASKSLEYNTDEFKKITEASVGKYRELMDLEAEEL